MSRVLRAALTQTRNAFAGMPKTRDELGTLRGKLEELRAANLAHHLELLRQAADRGVRLVCMGELFAGPYFAMGKDPMWHALAEDALQGPTVTAMRKAARALRLAVVAPIYELDGSSGRRFNTAVVIDEDGEVAGKYRKTHIPAGVNEEGEFWETFYYEASDGQLGHWPRNVSKNPYFPVFELSFGRLGVSICYDRHFAGVTEALAQNGAEVIVSPAVTFGHKSRRMWELEFAVDAARHNVFIGGSNRLGAEPPWNQEYFGASHFVGPNGPVATLEGPPELVIADLDLDERGRPDPSGWNLARDRRPAAYRTPESS
jgi:beta-ureidopropionase